ncbi:MAG TPA: tRNA guanosine(34) transglycosylase Tgt [Stellaceae bacterium]|nr:tRNA guanosine(34) transglycosylase Tgt [Stellaceae bacterium]
MTTRFELVAEEAGARLGRMETAHGAVETPAFMPVGTAATVKGMRPADVAATGAQIILANTYHLMLRPGAERVARLGGLHKFMDWPGPILTDSGGFQVMSLAKLREIDSKGVTFRSHLDGTEYALTPERAIEIQHMLDADIAMALDECTPFPATEEDARRSMELTLGWAERCKRAFTARAGYRLFGIVQGSVYAGLRGRCASALVAIGFDGYAVGGLAVGEGQAEMLRVLDETVPALPKDRPRYLMGVGTPADLLGSVKRGVDLFDCVLPTRSGRTHQAFTRGGTVNLRNARHMDDPRPLDAACPCTACTRHSRAYLHHLARAGEMLGPMLLTEHNLRYYADLMAGMRRAIAERRFAAFAAEMLEAEVRGDVPVL